jgi:hypothetical protein
MAKLIIVILSCEKCIDRRNAIRETWLKNCDIEAYFLIGRPGKPAELLGDTIYVDCEDTYIAHTYKMIAFYEYAHKYLDFDYIFKCDDDTYVDIETLLKLPYDQYHYLGFLRYSFSEQNDKFGKWRKYHYKAVEPHRRTPYLGKVIGPWAFGGSGYFLSNDAIKCIINDDKQLMKDELFEDKMIGDMMIRHGIVAENTFLLVDHINPLEDLFSEKWYNSRFIRFASAHPCTPWVMRILHQRNNFILFTALRFLRFIRNKGKI